MADIVENGDIRIDLVDSRKALLSSSTKQRLREIESLHDHLVNNGR